MSDIVREHQINIIAEVLNSPEAGYVTSHQQLAALILDNLLHNDPETIPVEGYEMSPMFECRISPIEGVSGVPWEYHYPAGLAKHLDQVTRMAWKAFRAQRGYKHE